MGNYFKCQNTSSRLGNNISNIQNKETVTVLYI
jgi:hypothetical protein